MLKRVFDLVIVICSCPVVLPVLLVVGICVRLKLGSPVLYRQKRPGLHGRIFVLYKFRTMRDLYNSSGELLPDGDRLTDFGRFLRSTSLDELPELYNVLKGDMSLVGPRPLLMEYLPLYSPAQARRHDVRPGLTGWAQIHGRNALSWEERFAHDLWYVDNQSLALDIKILLITMQHVVLRKGIHEEGQATMSKFTGT